MSEITSNVADAISESGQHMAQKMALVACICCDNSNANARLPLSSLLECAREVGECSQEEIACMENIFIAKPTGKMCIGATWFHVEKGMIQGLQLKKLRSQVRRVTKDNVDEAVPQYLALDGLPSYKKEQLKKSYEEMVALRSEMRELQTRLATQTFEILCADQARYKKMKQRTQTIDRTRRLARRQERQFFGPKRKVYPKKKRALLAAEFCQKEGGQPSRPPWTPLVGWQEDNV